MREFNDKLKNLVLLMEECGELTRAAAKTYRWGPDYKHPDLTETNRDNLAQKIGDVLAMIALVKHDFSIKIEEIEEASQRKLTELEKYYE